MGKHFNSKHDDNAWRALFGRWHAGEPTAALVAEAGVSRDTWRAHAKRLGMRISDLPPDHPRRRAPAFGERAADYRHRNSLLTEGQWADLFVKRARGAPDAVLAAEFGVTRATIGTQAKKRGLRRGDLRGGESPSTASRSPSPRGGEETGVCGGENPTTTRRAVPLPTGGEVSDGAALSDIALAGLGVRIARGDWTGTADSFDGAIEAAGARGDFGLVVALCKAKDCVKRAMFAGGAAPPPPPFGRSPSPSGDGEVMEAVARPVQLRPAQRPPEGDWATWLFLGGRGAGKTLAGAMWLAEMADRVGPGGRLALIGPTLHDVREVMIEGVSGLCALPRWGAPGTDGRKPVFEPSRRRLVFPNGALAHVFSAEDPDSLRGPQFSAAWADEFCTWRSASETLALLRMGLRLALPTGKDATARDAVARCLSAGGDGGGGTRPLHPPSPSAPDGPPPPAGEEWAQAASDRVASGSPLLCITTTPRPTAALRRLRLEVSCVETHAGTAENAAHLSPGFLAGLEALYGGTRRAAQEIEGKVVELEGALFTAEMLARAKAVGPQEKYDRIIVAIDPTTTAGGNACGIIVAGRIGDRAEVLADRSKAGLSPGGWARRTMAAAAEFGAGLIVAEVNQGGEMVKAVLKAEGCRLPVREVRATKGKRVRAEPVAALYEQGRVTHRRDFAALEEELMAFGGEDEGAHDLDRADALVWAITDLLIDRAGGPERGPRLTLLDAPPVRRGLSGMPAHWS